MDVLRNRGSADLATIHDATGIESERLTAALWLTAWRGEISNDTFASVRKGIETGFTASPARGSPPPSGRRSSRRSGGRGYREWRASRPFTGNWFALERGDPDPLTATEDDRERARTLLRRYGVVFRELVQREGAAYPWRSIFRALRLMELGGEVASGLFVRGVSSPQFAYRSALALLEQAPRSSRIVWMSAVDPASPCGLAMGEHYPDLPTRIAGNHLVFRGAELVMTGRRNGRDLTVFVSPDDPDIIAIVRSLENLVTRRFKALSRVLVETVNGTAVRESDYSRVLRDAGFRDEFRSYVLNAPYR